MVGPNRPKRGRGRGGGRRTASRSPAHDDSPAAKAAVGHSPLAPPPLPPPPPQPSRQTPPRSPPSPGSKRKFEDIAEVSWEADSERTTSAFSFSLDASIRATSDRPSRRQRSSYTLAASVTSLEQPVRTRSRRAATLERSVTRNPASSGFSKPNDSEKLVVKSRDGRECWLCSQSNAVMLETAHNVVASNRELFLNYRDTVGIFPPNLRHLASPHNLVTLCRNCHCVYDCQQPRWIILPTNISYFIDHEVADYESRAVAAGKGVVKPRNVPTAIEYATAAPTNLYMPYFFEESVMPRMDPEEVATRFPRAYGGAPTTMILKAGLGINQPKIKSSKQSLPPFPVGIPPSVRQQVTHLFELWDRDPPSPKKQPPSPAKPKRPLKDEGPSDSEDDETSTKKRRPRANPTNRKRKSPHSSQPPAEAEQDELADICVPTKKRARIANEITPTPDDPSPASQSTTATAMQNAGQGSQVSSATRRYNLRSQYRTPPTSPEFAPDIPTKKATGRGRPKRKAEAPVGDAATSKSKRVSTSSESVLATKSRKIAKATSKKDEKKTKAKANVSKPEATVAPLTPKSRNSPNDLVSKKIRSTQAKNNGVAKKVRLENSRVKDSIKRNAAALFADVGGITPAQKAKCVTGDGKNDGSHAPRLAQRHPSAQFDQEIEQASAREGFDSGASNAGSLDAQSGGYGEDHEHHDGYASDSGSERPDKEDWAWGPSHTANDVVEACVGWFGVGTSGRISD